MDDYGKKILNFAKNVKFKIINITKGTNYDKPEDCVRGVNDKSVENEVNDK